MRHSVSMLTSHGHAFLGARPKTESLFPFGRIQHHSDKTTLDELNKLAWEQAKVTGTANGDTISVKSVSAAK